MQGLGRGLPGHSALGMRLLWLRAAPGKINHGQSVSEPGTHILEPSLSLEGCTDRSCSKPNNLSHIIWKRLRRKLVASDEKSSAQCFKIITHFSGTESVMQNSPMGHKLILCFMFTSSVTPHCNQFRIISRCLRCFFVSLDDFFF